MDYINKPGGKFPLPRSTIFFVVALAVVALPLVIFLGLQTPGRRGPGGGAEYLQIPQKQKTEGEINISSDQVSIYMPQGATDLPGDFVISPREADLFAFASESDWTRPVVVDIEYRNKDGIIYPGVIFSKPVSICFRLSTAQWNDFVERSDDFQVQYYDGAQTPTKWVSLPLTKDPERYELCGEVNHLSIFALAVKPEEIIPVSGETLIPTASLSPTVTVFNTQESDRERKPFATGTPIPSATFTKVPPTKTLVPTNTPVPTNTLVPTVIVLPSNTPVPTIIVLPSNTPVPTIIVLPSNTPLPPTNPPPDTSTPVPSDPPTPDPQPTDVTEALDALIEEVLSGLGIN